MAKCKVTVPLYDETNSEPYLLTDFAVANGATCSSDWKTKNGVKSRSGYVWLRSAYSDEGVRVRGLGGGGSGDYAGSREGAVLPRFQNPQSSAIATSVASGKRFLTINGQNVLYPQSYAGEKLSRELSEAVKNGTIRAVGEYASDGESVDYDKTKNIPYNKQTNRSFNYKNKTYCYVEKARKRDGDNTFRDGTDVVAGNGYWFVCEPIEAEHCPDGSIQCKELLVPCQFEPQDKYERRSLQGGKELDTDEFAIGKFLGGDFLRDLQRSVGLQQSQSQDNVKDDAAPMQAPGRTRAKKGYGVEVIDTPMSKKDQIKNYIENGRPFMMHGPSGVGKTRRIEEIDPDLTPITLRDGILPEEIIGKTIYPNGRQALPSGVVAQLREAIKEVKGADADLTQELENLMKGMTVEPGDQEARMSGKWAPPYWYERLCKICKEQPDKKHVVFVDEITNVRPTVQSLVYYIVLNHSIGANLGKLPDNAVVVAAGNSKKESEAAYNMAEPLFRRFYGHVHLDLNVNDWLEWGSEKNAKRQGQLKVHPIVSSFVATYSRNCFHSEYDRDNPPDYALDPRGWEQVSDMIYDNKGQIRRELIADKIGKENAATFLEFAKNPPLTADDVLDDNYDQSEIPDSADGKFALAMSLRHTGEKDIKKVRQFVSQQLGGELASTFDSLWVGEDAERAMILATESQKLKTKMTLTGTGAKEGVKNDRTL